MEKEVDMINSPPQYNQFNQEVIVTIEDWVKGYEDPFVAYCIGNVLKYLSRSPYKGKFEEDLGKAGWYLNHANNYIENKLKHNDEGISDGRKLQS